MWMKTAARVLGATAFVVLLHVSLVAAVHEYLHCLGAWAIGGSKEDCRVVFLFPDMILTPFETSARARLWVPGDHWVIKPLTLLFDLWLWLKLAAPGDPKHQSRSGRHRGPQRRRGGSGRRRP